MIVLIILAAAILIDIAFHEGDALAHIFRAIGSIFHKPQQQTPSTSESEKLEFIQALKEEIDELYDELSYDNSEIEETLIREQIKYKQTLIEKLMND
jgi:hypothetical protein